MSREPYKPVKDQKKKRNAPETRAVPLQCDYLLRQQSDPADSPTSVHSRRSRACQTSALVYLCQQRISRSPGQLTFGSAGVSLMSSGPWGAIGNAWASVRELTGSREVVTPLPCADQLSGWCSTEMSAGDQMFIFKELFYHLLLVLTVCCAWIKNQ